MHWQWSRFHELSLEQLYEVLSLRQRVFVVEQNCPYQDSDALDVKAWHLLGWQERENQPFLCAYLRVFAESVKFSEASLGRVVTAPEVRRQGIGNLLMTEGMKRLELQFGRSPVRISAQAYLVKFYNQFGFRKVSEIYLEDQIPHVQMLYVPQNIK